MELLQQFNEAVLNSKSLPVKPTNDVLLQLYSLYKQASEGDIATEVSSNTFDFVARAKHNAWEELKGKSKEAAMQEYTDLVAKLKG